MYAINNVIPTIDIENTDISGLDHADCKKIIIPAYFLSVRILQKAVFLKHPYKAVKLLFDIPRQIPQKDSITGFISSKCFFFFGIGGILDAGMIVFSVSPIRYIRSDTFSSPVSHFFQKKKPGMPKVPAAPFAGCPSGAGYRIGRTACRTRKSPGKNAF